MIKGRKFTQARFAEQCHMDGKGHTAQAGIGADIGCGFFAADVLFAGRQREHIAAVPIGVDSFAANPARHRAHELLAAGKEPHMRPAKVQTHADALAFTHHNIRALFARAFYGAERNDFIKDSNQEGAFFVGSFGKRLQIDYLAKYIGGLHNDTGSVFINQVDGAGIRTRRAWLCLQIDAEILSDGTGRFGVMGVQTRSQNSFALFPAGDTVGHNDRFGAGGRAVIHRGIGNLHTGQHGDLCLKLEQGLKGALGYFRLIRRIGREKFRALNKMVHGCRDMMFIGPGPAEKRD